MIPHWPSEPDQDDPLVADDEHDTVYVTEDIETAGGDSVVQAIGNEECEEWIRMEGVSAVDVEEHR